MVNLAAAVVCMLIGLATITHCNAAQKGEACESDDNCDSRICGPTTKDYKGPQVYKNKVKKLCFEEESGKFEVFIEDCRNKKSDDDCDTCCGGYAARVKGNGKMNGKMDNNACECMVDYRPKASP